MSTAIIVITHLWNTDFVHWWHLYFDPAEKPWYEGQVWGNVFAVLPLAVLGTIGYWVHKFVAKEHEDIDVKLERQHNEHSEHLKKILDALDPETPGSLANIEDALDPQTPSGIGEILKRLDHKS